MSFLYYDITVSGSRIHIHKFLGLYQRIGHYVKLWYKAKVTVVCEFLVSCSEVRRPAQKSNSEEKDVFLVG